MLESTRGAAVRVSFPDGQQQETAAGALAGDLLREWRPTDSAQFLAASWEGVAIDLSRPITASGRLAPLTFEDRAGRDILQHSSAHLVAKGVVESIPEALPTVGPPTDEGFYYDFDVRPLTPADLEATERSIRATIKVKDHFVREELTREAAERLFANNPHKLRYIAEIPAGEPVSVYRTGSFVDLCRGPHVPDAGWLEGLHIYGFSGIVPPAEKPGPVLQRVRGIGFPTRSALDQFLKMRKEAEARDHRVAGQKFELFMFVDESPGFPFWLPNGMVVVRELERYVLEHLLAAGYSEVRTPLLFAQSVYERSGHWEHYRADMFLSAIDDRPFGLKPMNCPGSMIIFGSRARSYRELPMRLAEFAPLHRLEGSGTIHGMTRVREFVQDDAHLFVTEEQIEGEVRALLEWVREAFTTFRLEWSYELSTRPAQFLGEPAQWDRAEAILEKVLKESGVQYRISPGEGAFYGPKVDIHVRDSLGRPWQTGTIQLDYQMPRRFGLEYQGQDGLLHTPVVIHRTILGSWERFFGVFLEHCAGRLPPWLAPVQVRVLPVTDRHEAAATGLVDELRAAHIRAVSTGSAETLGKRVRAAELDRIPYIAVLGDQEAASEGVAVRFRGSKEQRSMSRAEFLAHVLDKIRTRGFDP